MINMDIQINPIRNNAKDYLSRTTVSNDKAGEVETIDLDALAMDAYNEEKKKNDSKLNSTQTLFESAKAQLQKYKASAADVSEGNVKTTNSLANLAKEALNLLQNKSENDIKSIQNNNIGIKVEKLNNEINEKTLNFEINNETGTVSGPLSPGTNKLTFSATSYNFNDFTLRELIAVVYAEAAENEYLESDTMGVTSVILNRYESGKFGPTIHDIIFADRQFDGINHQKFERAMEDPSCVKPEMISAINRVLGGERNTDGLYFYGNGTYNSFR